MHGPASSAAPTHLQPPLPGAPTHLCGHHGMVEQGWVIPGSFLVFSPRAWAVLWPCQLNLGRQGAGVRSLRPGVLCLRQSYPGMSFPPGGCAVQTEGEGCGDAEHPLERRTLNSLGTGLGASLPVGTLVTGSALLCQPLSQKLCSHAPLEQDLC